MNKMFISLCISVGLATALTTAAQAGHHGDMKDQYRSYDKPQDGYGKPKSSYGYPQRGYGYPQRGYSYPQRGYQNQQRSYGYPQRGYGNQQRDYGYPQHGYGYPQKDYSGQQQSPAASADQPATNSKPEKSSEGGKNISISGMQYMPGNITVSKGTTITWTQQDSAPHTVSSSNGIFESGTLSRGQSFSYTFNDTGTFDYYCKFHPNMRGTITVSG